MCRFPVGSLGNIWYTVSWAHPTNYPNGISTESAVFAKYTFVTNGQTDGRITTETELTDTELGLYP